MVTEDPGVDTLRCSFPFVDGVHSAFSVFRTFVIRMVSDIPLSLASLIRYYSCPQAESQRSNTAKRTKVCSQASPVPCRTMASAAELFHRVFRVRGHSRYHISANFPLSAAAPRWSPL